MIERLLVSVAEKESPGVLIIALDIDGVIADIDQGFNDYASREKPELDWPALAERNRDVYRVDRWPEVIKAGLQEWVIQAFATPAVFEGAALIPGARETINAWRRSGHQVFLITARPENSLGSVTREWFSKKRMGWLVREERIIMAPSINVLRDSSEGGREGFKENRIRALGPHVVVEDHGPNLARVFSPRIMVKACLKYPYNEKEELGPQAIFVEGWPALDEIIQETSRWHHYLFSLQTT